MLLSERLTQLGEILVALSGTPIPSQQFQALADYAIMAIPYDYLAVCLVDPDGQGYLVHSLAGKAAGAIPQRLFALSEGSVGQVIRSNRPLLLEDLSAYPDGVTDLEEILGRAGLRAALIAPLQQESRALGALLLAAEPPTRYGPEDLQIGRLLAAGLSAALENARLYQSLADERSVLSAVLGSSQDGVLVVNDEGIVLLANPAAGRMLGVEAATLAGRPLAGALADEGLLRLLAARQAQVVELTLPAGGTAQASLVQVRTEYGEIVGWAAVFRDITLLKELEQMKNEFVNTVSHDLKNPIGVITLATDLLDKVGSLNARQQEMRGRIQRTAAYMNELVTDLLDLGKIEAGLGLRLELCDLAQLAREVCAVLRPDAERKRQALTLAAPERLEITADKNRLRQVLLNLVGNGVKYTPAEGVVQVVLTAAESGAVVKVVDNGMGIPAADLPYVFDKFYRVKNEQTKHIKGTGLGLAIAKSVIEAHGGRIWVDSTPGHGSTFTFTLPFSREEASHGTGKAG